MAVTPNATGRTWVLEQHGDRPLTINKARTLHPQAWATVIRNTRRLWWGLAKERGIPRLRRACITVTPLHRNGRSPQDAAACAPAAKAAVDGLVDALVLPDDTEPHLPLVVFTHPEICGADGLRLTIEELTS